MLTHRPSTDNFAFVNLTTVDEANRAIKQLHGSRLFASRIVVQSQRSNGPSRLQPKGQSKGSPVDITSPVVKHTLINNTSPNKENIRMQPLAKPKKVQAKAGAVKEASSPSANPSGAATSFYLAPHSDRTLTNFAPLGFVSGGKLLTAQTEATNTPRRARPRGQPQDHPSSYDGASGAHLGSDQPSPGSDMQHISLMLGGTSNFDPKPQQFAPAPVQVATTQSSANQVWPPLVSSGPFVKTIDWSSFDDHQLDAVYKALVDHCHDTGSLASAGFNTKKPTMPPMSELKAKVKCVKCRQTRRQLDIDMAKTGKKGSSAARGKDHAFLGVSHLARRYEGFKYPPQHSDHVPKRRAIALDCEMAGAWNGDGFVDELIQLTAIDYLTGEVLISALVSPTLEIRQWRTSIHGVSRGMMAQAVEDGSAMRDLAHARNTLFSFMDDTTILVGHALHNDLNILKIAHSRCVDSEVLAVTAISRPGRKQTGLKKLCESLMGLGVQRMSTHSCLEDSFAAREAVIYMTTRPEALAKWAEIQQQRLDKEEAKRQAEKEARTEIKEMEAVAAATAMQEESGIVPSMETPTLIPTPSSDIPAELQTHRGPAAGKKRKGGQWKAVDHGL